LKKDGGFLVIAEERKVSYSSVQPINQDRSISFSLYDTYYYNARDFWTGIPKEMNTYQSGMNYNNILILNANSHGELQWGNVIAKKQQNGPGWLSFATIFREEKLDFFYNKAFKTTWLLENKSVTLDGKVIDNRLIRGLQNSYIFIPSRGRQTSENEFIIPYIHNNNLSFAKIEF
jgi:hypothetical protein